MILRIIDIYGILDIPEMIELCRYDEENGYMHVFIPAEENNQYCYICD